MTTRPARRSRQASGRDGPQSLPFGLDGSKLAPPRPRPGLVDRVALVERLSRADAPPILAVTAPAGYGKSTLLAQWAARKAPRVAWLSADDDDNDPAVLLTYLAAALDRVEPLAPEVFRTLATSRAGMPEVGLLASAIAAMDTPVSVVVDHADALTNRASRDVIAELAMRLPAGSQMAIGSRQEVPVPVARLRSEGRLAEFGVDDLAMATPEAQLLLVAAGVELSEEDVEALMDRTEGWPVGLYLAALATNAGGTKLDVAAGFTGADRYVGDYLRSEFLARVSRADVTFLTRTSILDRLCGRLCDAVVGRTGASRVLDRLERSNLLVIPLDRQGEWYRYHHLFRDLLHAELMRREPETVPELHARAAAWYEADGTPEVAIGHAQQAGEVDLVARLVLATANPVWASGRQDTVLRWIEWFAAHGAVEREPAVAIHGALIYALTGRAGEADRWAAAAERTELTGVLPDGNTMEGSLAYLRTLLCRDGIDAMRIDARLALDGLRATSPYRPAMLHALGAADLLQRDPDRADVLFARAYDEAVSAGVVPFVPVALAERGMLAIERGEWDRAGTWADEAIALMAGGQFDDYWTSALVYAWVARVATHRGEAAQARDLVTRAARLRPLLTYALPILATQALRELANAYIALTEPAGAQAALRQIRDIQQHRPDLGTMYADADELRVRLDALKVESLGLSSLTTAELRLLPMLSTHLSLAEISERLYVSRNTVKTQTISIYRKLGVTTRGEAVSRLQQHGVVVA